MMMIAKGFTGAVPAGLRRTPGTGVRQRSSPVEASAVCRTLLVRKFKSMRCLPFSNNGLCGSHAILKSCRSGSTKRLSAGNFPIGGVHSISRDPAHAIPATNARLLWMCPPPSRRDRCLEVSYSDPLKSSVDGSRKLLSDESPGLELSNANPLRKKKVAIWIGYVGTAFKGLQILRGPEAVNTIEYELERAIYQAGGILDTNYGHLDKVGWSRSSRTDKGVHSLSTVVSMKMEIPFAAWTGDPDGLILADRINLHLPPTVQVFGVVPVTKAFDARRFCCNRTYHYLLPASLIGVSGDTSPETLGPILEKFRSILNMFQGRFAFHNYTIRRLYRADVKSKRSPPRNQRHANSIASPDNAAAASVVEDELDEDAELPGLPAEVPSEVPIVQKRIQNASDRVMAYWLNAPDLGDKLSASHFRRILDCSCGSLESFGGSRFVRISVTGESFMVHQIRKMVATAVGVLNGALPDDIIPISLCRHARVVLPLAPAEGLLLAKNSFYPFRQLLTPAYEKEFRESDVGLARLKELPKLQITKQMSDKVDVFWRDVLLPEMAPQLDGSLPLWSAWLENVWKGTISEAQLEPVRASYTSWREESEMKMNARVENEALDVA